MNIDPTITLKLSQLRKRYFHNFPYLVSFVRDSEGAEQFKTTLQDYVVGRLSENTLCKSASDAARRIILTAEHEGRVINEFSTGADMRIATFESLLHFLRGEPEIDHGFDMLIDLYYMFMQFEHPRAANPKKRLFKYQMERWESGLDTDVRALREKNRERIVDLLIAKIERRKSPSSRYVFAEGATREQKQVLVNEWWDESRFHLSMAIKSPTELNNFLGNSLSEQTMSLLVDAKHKGMPFFITPYYLSLLNPTKHGYDDSTIRSYIIYSRKLVETYGNIRAWEKEDTVVEGQPNAAGWLLPDGYNIHRRYPEVAILIPDSMGRACGGLCASCQRMYDFQSERLNFDFESLKPKDTWEKRLRRLMHYFEYDAQLRDILITGGDALMSQNKTLKNILEAVYRMAVRKQKANKARYDGEKYAELQRVRLGSRLLAYLPMRINDELLDILREFKQKASEVGVKQFIIQTHFQSPLEITPQVELAIAKILSCGWIITNQLVYTVAASRRGHTARLRESLNKLGVICYYTFSVKGFDENYEVFTPISRSMQEQQEEKIFGMMTPEQQQELSQRIDRNKDLARSMNSFMKSNHLPFLSTDRSVLNLPAIGKSMTFTTVGLTSKGRRILKFEHDAGRHHSPIIDQIGAVYIVENKSIAAYMRQLVEMGEDVDDYASIWNYSHGVTEPRFGVFEYPTYDFSITGEITNLQLPGAD